MATLPAVEDFKAGDAKREPQQKATQILAALKISRGDWVADVGAGGGYYSMRLAELVGDERKVFAEDISDSSMEWLSLRKKLFNLSNIEIVKGTDDDPKPPLSRLSAVLIVDSYHHFTNPKAMLDKILPALRPEGRLVIADFSLQEHQTRPRPDQLKIHEIDPELVKKELESAGYDIVSTVDPLVKWSPEGKSWRPADLWLMTAIRPK